MRSSPSCCRTPSVALLLGALLSPSWALAAEAGKTPAAPDSGASDRGAKTPPGLAPDADTLLTDPAELRASRGRAWSADGAQYLLLEGGDATFNLGTYGFSADRAIVRIVSEKKLSGAVHHLTLFLENARDPGGNSIGAAAPRLTVTAATTGAVRITAPLLAKVAAAPTDAPGDDFIASGLRRLAPAPAPAPAAPEVSPLKPGKRPDRETRRRELEASRQAPMRAPDAPATAADAEPSDNAPSLPGLPAGPDGKPSGPIHSSADRLEFVRGKDGKEDAALLMGRVRLSWETAGRMVEAQAENVVIFLNGGAEGGSLDATDASKIAGIYLEDNVVIGDGNQTVRSPRAYFDVARRRATLFDAVMYAMDTQVRVPLYMRAHLLRENAGDSFEARGVTLSNNGFAEPTVALGARRLTLAKRPADPADPGGKERGLVTLSGVTPQIEGVPFLWFPYAALPGWRIPLRTAYAGYSTNNGAEVRTTWGVYDLLDIDRPRSKEDLTANLDVRGQHGAALGGKYEYRRDDSFGLWRGYALPDDRGVDRIPGRDNVDHDGEHRYFLRGDHRHFLTPETDVTLHAAKSSDPTIQETFFDDGQISRAPETGASIRHAHEDWALSATGSFQLDKFTPSLTDLEARGFQTERIEGEFRRIATSLFEDRVNWYSENRLGRVRAAVGRDAPATRGIADWASIPEFGISNTVPFALAAQVQGVPTGWVNRLDSRQELALPLQSGPVDVTPYGVVRYTQWSDTVAQPGGAEDSKRLYGGGGVRLATELVGTAVNWKSEWLDIDGLRHIIRPEADFGWYGSSMRSGTLPMYDPDVEGLGEGGFVRAGFVSTLQTHRGENGNRHVVDWIRFKQDFVFRSGEEDANRVIPRFVDWRPEYALGGNHAHSELLWQATNALAVNVEAIHSFESEQIEQWGIGGDYVHSERLTSHAGYRETQMYDEHMVNYGFTYRLTPKYDLSVNQMFNIGPVQNGWINGSLDRRFPGGLLRLIGSYDELNGSYSLGIGFSPQGFAGGGINQTLYQRQPK